GLTLTDSHWITGSRATAQVERSLVLHVYSENIDQTHRSF
ncbi:MAG: hypothetical protein ACI8VW_002267, partial [bacterium]